MKHSNVKAHAFKGGAALAIAVLFFAVMAIGCSNGSGSDGGTPTFKVTLEKNVGGNVMVTPTLPEDGMVAENTDLTFTAEPLPGYVLEKWELNGTGVNGTALTYTLKVTANAQVKVFFKTNGTPITKHTVTLTPPTNGTITSVPEIPSDNQLPEGTEIVFTATPNDGYAVDTWTVSPGSFTAGGTAGSATATVKVTADITVGVTFKLSGGGGGGGGNIEGVWKIVSSKTNDEEPVPFPVTMPDNSTLQPYFCFSEGKVYSANEIAGKADDAENGLFKDAVWDVNYTFVNGILIIAEASVPFIITGDTATMTMTDEGNTMVIQLTRVSAPTVAEIKAAK